MLINTKEIYNLALLDSEFFDREGFLLVKDNRNSDELNFVERLVRLRGNLLFILKIPNLSIDDSQLDKSSLDKSSLDKSTLDKQIDDRNRINLLIDFYRTNCRSKLDFETVLQFVIVLPSNEFSLRRIDEREFGFIIEFHNVVDNSNQKNIWFFTCLTQFEREQWIDQINRLNYVNLRSIFNLLIERKLDLLNQKNRFNQSNEQSSLTENSINKSISSYEIERTSSNDKSSNNNQSLHKSTSIASLLSILSIASSTESNNESIISHISTTTNLTTQNNLIHQNRFKSKDDSFKSIFLTDSYFKHRTNLDHQLTASFSFTLNCDFRNYLKYTNIQPNIFIKVYCSLTNGLNWSSLGKTETLKINANEQTKFAKKFYLNLYEKIELQNNLNKIVKFDVENNQILLKFNIYNLIESFTGRFILIGIAINYFEPNSLVEIFSSIHYKSTQIGQLKMTTLDNEFNIFDHQNGKISTFKINCFY